MDRADAGLRSGPGRAGARFFSYHPVRERRRDGALPPAGVASLLEQGWLRAEPIVYEDFLPRSAAGIFQSNLSGEGAKDSGQEGVAYDAEWLSGAIDRDILDPFALYEQQQDVSLERVARESGFDVGTR